MKTKKKRKEKETKTTYKDIKTRSIRYQMQQRGNERHKLNPGTP